MNLSQLIRKRGGEVVLSINLLLLLLLALVYAPFMPYNRTYMDAPSVFDKKTESIKSMDISFGKGKERLKLLRSDEKAQPDGAYRWTLQLTQAGGAEQSFEADESRIKLLFESLRNSKKYYSINYSDEKAEQYGMKGANKEECDCVSLVVRGTSDQVLADLRTGKNRGGESPVLEKGDTKMYLVAENLMEALGVGDPMHFRSRTLLRPPLEAKEIRTIRVKFPGKKQSVEIAKGGEIWQIVSPVTGPAKAAEISTLVTDLSELKVSEFLTEIPENLDRSHAMDIELIVQEGDIGKTSVRNISILGQTGYGRYLLAGENGEYLQITDYYLEKLERVEETLLETKPEANLPVEAVP